MPSIKTQDLYRVVITEAAGIAASGDVDFTVSTPPTRTNGFLVLSPENSVSREVVYFHNVIGNRIYVRGVNRRNPKLHPANDSVQMNDVEDIFNYYSDMVSPLFYMEKTGSLGVRIWGGTVLVNRTQVTVADTNLTLTDNTTNYIVYDYLTNIVSVNTTGVGLVKVTVTVTSGIIGTPTYNVIKESYADPSIPDLALVAPEVQKQTWVYAAATGAVNTYAITLTPAITSYQVGQKFTFKANLANTGTATLNVNGLGAKTIKKLGGTDVLASGDIAINQMVEVEYNGTDFDMQSPIANTPSWTNLIQSFTAGETIAAGNAVYMNTDGLVYLAGTTTTFLGFAKSTVTTGQSVIVDINGISTTQTSLSVGSKYYLSTSENVGNRWNTNLAMTTARYGAGSGLVNNRIYIIGGTVNGSSSMATNEEYNPLLNTWASKTAMTTARFGIGSAVYNNKIYCIGGYNGSYIATNEEYDPVANTWASKTNMTTARADLSVVTYNNKIYCIGGYNGTINMATNEEYDPVANTWASKTAMITARRQLASSVYNNKIYCVGGYNGSHIVTNEEYDPVANTWASKANMTTAREALVSVTSGTKIYHIGGWNGSVTLATNEEYDPVANTWASKTAMTTARYKLSIQNFNNDIYCIGGTTNGSSALTTNETYTPATNSWIKTSMTTARFAFASGVVSSKIYCIGGTINGTQYLQTNEEYDPLLNTWASKANMTTGRQELQSSVYNNKIYCIGGRVTGGGYANHNEEYDPVANTWASKANMTTARTQLSVVTYINKIYCIGGYNGSYLATNEEYDPVANTWASKANMTTARYGLVAQTYNNKIYCIGGHNGSHIVTNEEYDPVANTWASKTSMGTVRYAPGSAQSGGFIYVFGGETTGPTRLVTSEAYDISANTWSSKASMTNARSLGGSGLVNGKAYIIGGYNGSSGLSFNEEYTLPNYINSGTITTTPNSTKVGVATSATSLLIQTNF